ncbi:sensor histidine kinase KdpD [Curtobacterium sp. MCBD17_019]|uniref:sensor histidine kinase n=1 Tax=Curtobacterium sp. MCBD17_019 TaxID=2175669 RepID=UPI000DAA039B|nr:HAMP domain-containing sensor histidine kinase [Curtobacterium sp. MCBD17_019]PZE77693.1 two-component sensor histidine kinase [Curtobacterium sp. MCBD17_019]
MARRASLASRIVLTTVTVALLATFATVGVAYQLVRQVTMQQSREQLRATTLVVASTPPRERRTLVRNLDRTHARSIRLLLVHANGTTVPKRTGPVPAAAIRRVQTAGVLSERVHASGHVFLLQGERLSAGDTVIATQDVSLVRSATRRLLDRLLVAALFGVAVAVAVGIVVARLVVRPLRRAAAVARRLAGGERGMAAGAATHETITEVADIDDALATLDAALATSEGRQHEFLLSVSHEIRTPLTAIRGYADALADGLVPEQGVAAVGRTLVTETARLDAFTRDLLELARLEADDFPLRPEPVDVAAIATQALTAWDARADGLGVRLALEAHHSLPTCVSDPMRVRQLLDGLLENALRAAPAGSAVTVRIAPGDDPARPSTTITVEDGGPGLSDADLSEAFQRGLLADRYRRQRAVGTGLGLSIAHRLVGRLGGSLRAGHAPGGGAAFTLTLPASGGKRADSSN